VNGALVSRGSRVLVTATATDNVGVSKVEFYVNNALKSSDASAPYGFTWKVPTKRGITYQIHAKAYDAKGNVGTSGVVTVTAK